jgi:hypothetical protein
VNIASLTEFFKDNDWKYVSIKGSPFGNTSFLMHFIKNVLIGKAAFDSQKINRLLDEQPKILYLRPTDANNADKKLLADVTSVSLVEYIANEDAFNYRDVLRYLHNRRYTYLIIDEVRLKYDDNRFDKFSEILSYAESAGIKVIVSVTDSRAQNLDYMCAKADIMFDVTSYLTESIYEVMVEDIAARKYQSYTLPMK